MIKHNLKMNSNTADEPPDIFRAAENNDVEELLRALEDGQSLTDRKPDLANVNPVHLACIKSSVEFILVAVQQDSFDPWARDDNMRTAFDHASARNLKKPMEALFEKMHPISSGHDLEI